MQLHLENEQCLMTPWKKRRKADSVLNWNAVISSPCFKVFSDSQTCKTPKCNPTNLPKSPTSSGPVTLTLYSYWNYSSALHGTDPSISLPSGAAPYLEYLITVCLPVIYYSKPLEGKAKSYFSLFPSAWHIVGVAVGHEKFKFCLIDTQALRLEMLFSY